MDQEAFVGCMMEKPADFYYGVLWNKLYRRDIIQEHQLQMNPEINWCEDFMFNLEYIRHARRFYALHTPIYYYVKTKGSLASQGINLSKTIKMKLTVFAYYNDFYKNVLDEEEYEKNRLQVYRFHRCGGGWHGSADDPARFTETWGRTKQPVSGSRGGRGRSDG